MLDVDVWRAKIAEKIVVSKSQSTNRRKANKSRHLSLAAGENVRKYQVFHRANRYGDKGVQCVRHRYGGNTRVIKIRVVSAWSRRSRRRKPKCVVVLLR